MSKQEIIYKNVKDLIPYVNNTRTHDEKQVKQIAASIKEFGFTNPVLVGESNDVIAGHGRILAAEKLGIEQVPTIELKGLSEAQKKAYIIADNKLALNAGWDEDLLKIELEGLKELDFDLSVIGFNSDELDDIFKTEQGEVVDDDFDGELPEEPNAKIGDVYQLGRHRLMCGDSTSAADIEILMDNKKADMVFTDPPYGVSYTGNSNPNTQNKHNSGKSMEIINDKLQGEDLKQLFQKSMTNAFNSTTGKAVFYIWYATSKTLETLIGVTEAGLEVRAYIFWYKVSSPMSAFMSQYIPNYEPLLYCYKKGSTTNWYGATDEKCVWEQQVKLKERVHPTEKPTELPARAITNSSKMNDIVLDCFGGSGSTLMACEQLNRSCYMMELDPKYVDVIINRWEQFTGEKAVLLK